MSELRAHPTPIPGLLLVDLPVHRDSRGWFKENWQREKMTALGLPDFFPVQNNISFNTTVGATRGIHAESWDKLISVASGSVFATWVDLRQGESFGATFSAEIDPGRAVFVPRGVGNSYQTLEADTVYTYLVNDYWSADATYTNLNLADETVAIAWPIPLVDAEISDKDRAHPRLPDVVPMAPRKTLIIGASGQLGKALVAALPEAEAWTEDEFDLTDRSGYERVSWRDYGVIINAAAYTAVDAAETTQGRRDAWRVNVSGLVELAKVATLHGLTLVHVSSDYVFDGEEPEHGVDEGYSPLGVYGQTKAAGDAVVSTVPHHYIVRTSWVIGEGANFVSTMQRLAESGVDPSVVDDQVGRLTYTPDLAAAIVRLVTEGAPYGVHNVTSGGEPRSWYEIAREVFEDAGHDPDRVTPTSSAEYGKGKNLAPRPSNSTLS
ncbi:MAG: bifunctional dTDP-4-dehydrorhamnose 3,5-epimerase family protein/NAD(P)-dependent oxidoreductase [Aeromicrobium sp.]